MEKVEEILKRFEQVKTARQSWESDWQTITDYCLPRRSNWEFNQTENHDQKTLYDNTAVSACQQFADGIQGNMLNDSIKWLGLRISQQPLMELHGVKDWLEACEEVMYNHFNQSNFYQAINEFLLDFGGPGTATMYIGDDPADDEIYYLTRHPKEIYITQDQRGRINTLYRRFFLTGLDILDAFKEDELSPEVFQRAKETPNYTHEFLHVVGRRIQRDPLKIDNGNMPFYSLYLDTANRKVIRESGYNHFPYVVARIRRNSDEVYARPIGMDVISAIKGLQLVKKSMNKALQLEVEPPMAIPQHLLGKLRITPRGQNVVMDPTNKPEPIKLGANYPWGKDIENDMRQAIRSRWFEDFFLMLNRADRQMTAREVMERQGEKAAILSSIISQLNSELLNPLVDRVFHLLVETGKIPPPPQALQQFPGATIDVDFKGPMAEAARRSQQSSGVLSAIEITPAMMQWAPEVIDNLDTDILFREALTAQGVPQRIIREIDDRDKRRKAREKQMAQMQAMQQAQVQADIYQKQTRAPEEGSPMEGVA